MGLGPEQTFGADPDKGSDLISEGVMRGSLQVVMKV